MGGFVSWINTFDKVQREGFRSLATPSPPAPVAVIMRPSSSRLDPQRKESSWRKGHLTEKGTVSVINTLKGCRVLAKKILSLNFREFCETP